MAGPLGSVVAHGTEPLADGQRWLLCGAVALYLVLGLVGAVAGQAVRVSATLAWAVTGVATPIALAALGSRLDGTILVAMVAVIVLGHLAAVALQRRSAQLARP